MGFKYFSDEVTAAPNPDPQRFNIVERNDIGDYSVLIVHYHGCTTYGGMKVLITRRLPQEPRKLDPHFYPGGPVVARFPYTKAGVLLAELCVLHLGGNNETLDCESI